jgi:3-isopropylmalate/(R)-2-methylmalate dehydratase small subunit
MKTAAPTASPGDCVPFAPVTSVVAWMPEDNVDTDIIFPARFLLITEKAGLGRYAFHDRRFTADGAERADFVLNEPRYRGAQILLAGGNFGCGSSREQAPWALRDLGLRCILATGFGEIFAANCYQNGILPLTLQLPQIFALMPAVTEGVAVTVDLGRQEISCNGQHLLTFDVPERRRLALLNGWDDTQLILQQHGEDIARFEARHCMSMYWLF